MTLEQVQSGGPLSAQHQNALVGQVNQNSIPGAAGRGQYGSAGITFNAPPKTLIGLFELGGAMVYPDGSDPDEPDVPYTEAAKLVWLNHVEDQYGGTDASPEMTLYHPTCFRDDSGLPIGIATFSQGQRCYGWYNRQSGRWEIMAPALDILRFELGEDLTAVAGGSSESVVVHESGGILDGDDEMPLTVHDAFGRFYARGGSGSLRGCMGYAMWLPDMQRWEIISMQEDVWVGKLDETLNPGGSAAVSLWWPNNTSGVMEDSGKNITAYDWLLASGTTLASGSKVIVQYDSQHQKWWVINGEGAYGA